MGRSSSSFASVSIIEASSRSGAYEVGLRARSCPIRLPNVAKPLDHHPRSAPAQWFRRESRCLETDSPRFFRSGSRSLIKLTLFINSNACASALDLSSDTCAIARAMSQRVRPSIMVRLSVVRCPCCVSRVRRVARWAREVVFTGFQRRAFAVLFSKALTAIRVDDSLRRRVYSHCAGEFPLGISMYWPFFVCVIERGGLGCPAPKAAAASRPTTIIRSISRFMRVFWSASPVLVGSTHILSWLDTRKSRRISAAAARSYHCRMSSGFTASAF